MTTTQPTGETSVVAVDLFAGAGGTSTGLANVCRRIGVGVELTAINHWEVALATHELNHPWARHLRARIEAVDPTVAFPGGRLDLMVASPECTHFSTARGGRPVDDQKRASPWLLLPWLTRLHVQSLLIENVPEFQSWGPLDDHDRPMQAQKGDTFRAFLTSIRSLGYTVDYRILNAADYGDATTRRRLFIMARRGEVPIHWPIASHSKKPTKGVKRWRPARDVIDWSLKGESLFARKRPLARATWLRIIAGLERYGGPEVQPYSAILRAQLGEDKPLTKAKGKGRRRKAFTMSMASGGAPRSVDQPFPTFVGKGGGAFVDPRFTVGVAGRGLNPRSVADPYPTMTHRNTRWLIQPFVLPPLGFHARGGKANKPRSTRDPFQTFTRRGGGHVVEPYMVTTDRPVTNRSLPRSTNEPMPTVVGSIERIGLVEPYIVPNFGERDTQEPRTHDLNGPLPSVTSHGTGALVEPFLTKYYSSGDGAASIHDPMPTLTAKDRMALIQPVIDGVAFDILFRMVQPKEMAGAMSFPTTYEFTGNRGDVVRQIGNAVAVKVAEALCGVLLSPPEESGLDSFRGAAA